MVVTKSAGTVAKNLIEKKSPLHSALMLSVLSIREEAYKELLINMLICDGNYFTS